jgi:hypothetical protein
MSAKSEIVLITHWFGHMPHFAECVLPFFLDRGYRIYHLTDKPAEASAFLSSVFGDRAAAISNLAIDVVEPEKSSRGKDAQYGRVEAHWRGVGNSLRRLFGELGRSVGIFHSWVDLYSHEYLERRVIEDAMSAPWCGLYVHPAELRIYKTWKRRFLENARDFFKQGRAFPSRLRAFDVPNARNIYFWDEFMPTKARRFFNDRCQLSVFPESIRQDGLNHIPSPSRLEIESFEKSHDFVVSLTGFLDRRKGFLTLMRVAKMRSASKWGFIFGGEIRWEDFSAEEKLEIQQFISRPPENCLCLARRLDDAEFDFVVQKSDLVYLAYENFFHSSNVQLKAAYFHKPMIAGPQHLVAERTRRFGMGWCLPEITEQAVADLLNQIDKKEIQRVIDSARFEEFCQEHSPERLNECLEEISLLVG